MARIRRGLGSLQGLADAAAARDNLGVHGTAASGAKLTAVDDLDSLSKPGRYRWDAGSVPANAPFTYGVLLVDEDGNRTVQQAWNGAAGEMAVRRDNAGIWSEWFQMWSDGTADWNLSATGYEVLPSGKILQWGSVVVGSNSGAGVVFPVAMTTLFQPFTNMTGSGAGSTGRDAWTSNESATGMNVNATIAGTIAWMVIGK